MDETKKSLLAGLLTTLLTALFSFFGAQKVREWLDDLLDKVEDEAATAGGIKQTFLTQLTAQIRAVFQIPDDIGGDED